MVEMHINGLKRMVSLEHIRATKNNLADMIFRYFPPHSHLASRS